MYADAVLTVLTNHVKEIISKHFATFTAGSLHQFIM
jgi:hypothetical protein